MEGYWHQRQQIGNITHWLSVVWEREPSTSFGDLISKVTYEIAGHTLPALVPQQAFHDGLKRIVAEGFREN